MEFRGAVLVTADGLRLRRKKLALKKDAIDQAAVDAAQARLLAWVQSGEDEPVPEQADADEAQPSAKLATKRLTKKEVAEAAEEKARDAQLLAKDCAAWKAALATQQERHDRRRGAYEKVRPLRPQGDAP